MSCGTRTNRWDMDEILILIPEARTLDHIAMYMICILIAHATRIPSCIYCERKWQ